MTNYSTKGCSLVMIVIHGRWWGMVIVIMVMVGVTTRRSEHGNACQEEGREPFLDSHS